jgi:hypothetical protein
MVYAYCGVWSVWWTVWDKCHQVVRNLIYWHWSDKSSLINSTLFSFNGLGPLRNRHNFMVRFHSLGNR